MRECFTQGNLQFALDATSLGNLKKCPRYYYYTNIEGWQRKNESIHLRFGLEVHQALADYEVYRTKYDHGESVFHTVRELLLRLDNYPDENDILLMDGSAKVKTKEALVRSIIWYLEHYAEDTATTVILENGLPAVEVSFRFGLERDPYVLCGHLDRIVEYQGSKFVMDRKTTTATLSGWYFDQYDPDNQMTVYTIAGQVVLDSPIRGVIIDGISISTDGYPTFGRGITYRNQARLDEWLSDLNYFINELEQYASDQYWPMRDTSCGMYGGCPFRKVCSSAPGIARDATLAADFVQLPEEERWNPLQARSISTTNSESVESGFSTRELNSVK